MPDENLLATLEASLRQTRATRGRRASRLAELEMEAEKLRSEIAEMDTYAAQTEATMFRILSSMISPASSRPAQPSDRDIEAALQQDAARTSAAALGFAPNNNAATNYEHANNQTNYVERIAPPPDVVTPRNAPPLRRTAEATSERFLDRTIPQATAMLLREAAAPLHVNEIYNRLLEGGFNFTGQNPTISIAVSLNRNRRFRKVAPGTFDLMIRDAAQQAS